MPNEAVIANITSANVVPASLSGRTVFLSGTAPTLSPFVPPTTPSNPFGTYTTPYLDGYTALYWLLLVAGAGTAILTIQFSNNPDNLNSFVTHPDYSSLGVGPNASILIPLMPAAPNLPRPVYVSGRAIRVVLDLNPPLTDVAFYLVARR